MTPIPWAATPAHPDRVVFDNLIQVLVFGCGYRRIADHFLWSAQDNFEWMDGFGNRSARSTSTSPLSASPSSAPSGSERQPAGTQWYEDKGQ
jgi:hypothetical protein